MKLWDPIQLLDNPCWFIQGFGLLDGSNYQVLEGSISVQGGQSFRSHFSFGCCRPQDKRYAHDRAGLRIETWREMNRGERHMVARVRVGRP